MVILHAGPPSPGPLALLVLLALAVSIFITAAIISDLQRKDELPAAKRSARSQRARSER